MIRRPPRSTQSRSSAASDVYKRQVQELLAKCAGKLGVRRMCIDLVDLEFNGRLILNRDMSLEGIGMVQGSEFKILGNIQQVRADTLDLHHAVREGRLEDVGLVCELSPKRVDDRDTNGNTPLHYAVETPEIAELFLYTGADPNARNKCGWAPLHRTAASNRLPPLGWRRCFLTMERIHAWQTHMATHHSSGLHRITLQPLHVGSLNRTCCSCSNKQLRTLRHTQHSRSRWSWCSQTVTCLTINCTSPVSYTHLRAHETVLDLVCRLLLEKKKKNNNIKKYKVCNSIIYK
eukprot:TRINITY_DN20732_c0_g1_i2.p1 TRINITY_DN20732_c0_g1~~TRINITY_DN20732_c0_g1_i2.p1  ORF type:complete len:290 (+),score=54.09 TRINITY_DN20732_c0_g1_i2:87-956(+)